MKPKSAALVQREYQLKHRLVGAVIMVSTAVLVIPWLLSEPTMDANIDASIAANITPPAGEQNFHSQSVPENVPQSVTQSIPLTGDTNIKTPETATQAAPPRPALAATENTTRGALLDVDDSVDDSTGRGGKPAVPATSSGGWAVRVGTFSKPANATAISALLADNGFTARKTTVKTALGGNATRIWLGPYAKKETAGEVSRQLTTLIGEKGFVTKYAP